jgi:hypothetical protein
MKKLLLTLFVLPFVSLNAQSIFRDNLSTYTSNLQLSGQGTWTNNSSNAGGLGNCSGALCTNARVLATSMSYLNYGTSANSLELKPDTDGCGTAFTAATGTNVYVALVLNISNALAPTPTDFFRVMSGSNSNVAFRLTLQSFGSGFYVGVSKGNGPVFYYSSPINYNTNHLIVLRYTKAAGTNDDVVRMYINPTVIQSEPATPDMAASTGTDASGNVDRLCFRQNAATGLPTGRAGLISISNSWSALAFPNLSNDQFTKSNFIISSNDVSNGILIVNSELQLDNTTLSIYDLQGRKIESKTISLTTNENTIAIQPILNSGIYIVEIVSNDKRFTQKIVVN